MLLPNGRRIIFIQAELKGEIVMPFLPFLNYRHTEQFIMTRKKCTMLSCLPFCHAELVSASHKKQDAHRYIKGKAQSIR